MHFFFQKFQDKIVENECIFSIFPVEREHHMANLNREYPICKENGYMAKFGSVNREDPKVIYITARLWISPSKEFDYKESIKIVQTSFRKIVSTSLKEDDIFMDRYILDYDYFFDYVTVGKKKGFLVEMYLTQKETKKLTDIKDDVEKKTLSLLNELSFQLRDGGFDVFKDKS